MQVSLSDIKVVLPQSAQESTLFEIDSFRIKSGEHILIKGESGKGKTTLLHMIAGLFLPASGIVEVAGEKNYRISHMSDKARCEFRQQHLGMVFQKLNLVEYLTAGENVELSLKASKYNQDNVKKALAAVGLENRMQSLTNVMSLGEQQRVAVARVVARAPDIILADEPTSSLDEKNSILVIDLLQKAAQNKTLIVVSHDHRIEKHFTKVLRFEDIIA